MKALLSLGGSTLLQRTLQAIRGCRRVERICVVGPRAVEQAAHDAGATLYVEEGETGIDNLLRGVNALQTEGQILYSASDMPFLQPPDVESVIDQCPPEAQLGFTVFKRAEWEAAFPGCDCIFTPLADGFYTGGGIHIMDAAVLRRIEPLLQKAFVARKNMVAMANLFGIGLVLRFALGYLVHHRFGPSTEGLRRRAEHILGCKCAIVQGCSPMIAKDIDDLADWHNACSIVQMMDETARTC